MLTILYRNQVHHRNNFSPTATKSKHLGGRSIQQAKMVETPLNMNNTRIRLNVCHPNVPFAYAPCRSRSNVSIVHIYFREESTTAKLRTELYGFTDLFGECSMKAESLP